MGLHIFLCRATLPGSHEDNSGLQISVSTQTLYDLKKFGYSTFPPVQLPSKRPWSLRGRSRTIITVLPQYYRGLPPGTQSLLQSKGFGSENGVRSRTQTRYCAFFFFKLIFLILLLIDWFKLYLRIVAVLALGCCAGFSSAVWAVATRSLWCVGFSLQPLPLVWSTASQCMGFCSWGPWAQ